MTQPFSIGQQVEFSEKWLSVYRGKNYKEQKRLIVVGFCRDRNCIRVRRIDCESERSIHIDFIKPIESAQFFTQVKNDFNNVDEQAKSVEKYMVALYELNRTNMGEDKRATLLQQRVMCRDYLKFHREKKQIEELQNKTAHEIQIFRNEERLMIVRSFVGI